MVHLLPLSLFRDWYIFYKAGEVMSNGISPYKVEGFLNPIQVAWLISFTTKIPFTTWVPIMISLSFLLIVWLAKRRSHWILLSLPFIFGMSIGSLDAFLWVPARLMGGWGLSLLTLKPQLGLLWIPLQLIVWFREKNWREIIKFIVSFLVLWGVPTLIQPEWIKDWLAALPPMNTRMVGAASIAGFSALTGFGWVYVALFAIVLLVLVVRKSKSFYVAAMFSPSFWLSDWMICAEFATWKFTLLSWALIPTGLSFNGAQFYWLLGLLTWLEQNPEQIQKLRDKIKKDVVFSGRKGK